MHPNGFNSKFGLVKQEQIVGSEFPNIAGGLGHVTKEFAVSTEGEPSTIFPGPFVLADPDAAVTTNLDTGHSWESVGHRTLWANYGVIILILVRRTMAHPVILTPGAYVRTRNLAVWI